MTVHGIGIDSHVGEVLFHLLVHLLACPFKQRLVEVAIAHFPGQIGDGGKEPIAHGSHSVEKRSKGFLILR